MEVQDLNIDYVDGISCVTLIAVFYFIGLKLIYKYFKDKQINYLYVGLTWMGMCAPWTPPAFAFLFFLVTGAILPEEVYFVIGLILIIVAMISWLLAFTNFVESRYKTEILALYMIYEFVIVILFFIFFFNNRSFVGIKTGVFQADLGWFSLGYMVIALATFLFTTIIFVRKTMKIQDPDTRLKGKFLMVAIFSIAIGSILDGFFTFGNDVLFVIYKLILISGSIEFYFAFFLPDFLKKNKTE